MCVCESTVYHIGIQEKRQYLKGGYRRRKKVFFKHVFTNKYDDTQYLHTQKKGETDKCCSVSVCETTRVVLHQIFVAT